MMGGWVIGAFYTARRGAHIGEMHGAGDVATLQAEIRKENVPAMTRIPFDPQDYKPVWKAW